MPHEIVQFVTEAVVRRCSVKKGVLRKHKVSGNFIKKRDSGTGVFL